MPALHSTTTPTDHAQSLSKMNIRYKPHMVKLHDMSWSNHTFLLLSNTEQ